MSADGVNVVRLDAGEWTVCLKLCESAVAAPETDDLTRKVAARIIQSLHAAEDARTVLK